MAAPADTEFGVLVRFPGESDADARLLECGSPQDQAEVIRDYTDRGANARPVVREVTPWRAA